MEESFKYGSCSLFRTPVWVSLPSDPEVALLLKPLSYSYLSSSMELQYLNNKDPEFHNYKTFRSVLLDTIVDTRNIIGFPDNATIINQLDSADITYLYDKLFMHSSISSTQLEALSDMLDIQFNSQFREDSWNCTICQSKKLDYARGCGFLPEDKRDPTPMLPVVNGRRFTTCPISQLDGYVSRQASTAHNLMDFGALPEDGGLGKQTEWFVKVALLYKRKIAEAERAAMDEHKNK